MAPSYEEVVTLLMTQKPDIVRDVLNTRTGRKRRNVTYSVFSCPLGKNSKKSGKDVFEKGSGWTNPYRHIASCLSDNDIEHLHELYDKELKTQSRNGI